MKFFFTNNIFIILSIRKNILKTISILLLAIIKISLKKQAFPSLFST